MFSTLQCLSLFVKTETDFHLFVIFDWGGDGKISGGGGGDKLKR